MTTYLDNCGEPGYCAKCQQPECLKRVRPYGFPYAIKKTEATLFQKLRYRGHVTQDDVVWLVR